jgi:hypothetical protein
MGNSLLRVVISEAGFKPLGYTLMVLALLLLWGKKRTWSAFVWLPVFVLSVWFSLPAIVGIFAGGYGWLAVVALWPFPVAAVILLFARPTGKVFGGPAIVGALIATGITMVLLILPRLDGIEIKIRFADSTGRPLLGRTFSYFVYGGAGGKHDGLLHTDSDGTASFLAYYPEAGSIYLKKAPDGRAVQFQTDRHSYQIEEEGVVLARAPVVPTIKLRPQDGR